MHRAIPLLASRSSARMASTSSVMASFSASSSSSVSNAATLGKIARLATSASSGGLRPTGTPILQRAKSLRPGSKEAVVNNILLSESRAALAEDWDTSASATAGTKKTRRCVLSVIVDNEAGVLSKISGLLASRGFNIESLTVSTTDVQDLSRMTVVLDANVLQIEQAQRQLEDLVEVWAVVNLTDRKFLERELLVVKVDCIPPTQRAETEFGEVKKEEIPATQEELSQNYEKDMARHFHRHSILEIAKMFGGNVADIGSEHIIIDMIAPPKRIDAFIHLIRPFGIIEAARSGVIAMERAKVNPLEPNSNNKKSAVKDDDLILPPS